MITNEKQIFLQEAQTSHKTEDKQKKYANRWYNIYLKLVENDDSKKKLFWNYWDEYIDRGVGKVLIKFRQEVCD